MLILSFAFIGGGTISYALDADPGTPTQPTDPAPTENTDTPDDTDTGTTCAIEKMGWILCPIIETAGKMGDQAFQFLSKTFLETEPELISNDENGTRKAWELARNLANIMFIIAFLIIIYSQVTGAGINNYGIKKMLPRLVIAALAVNLSYFICQLAVDFTNVLGYEIQNFMVNVAREVSQFSALPPAGSFAFGNDNPGTLQTIIAAVLGVAAVVWFLLPFLFMGIATIVVTCLVIIIILLLRKALIVILIVAAPIAFVLYLLPNTEKFFKQWASMFWKLLLVFPIVGILMGGGQLASAIVLAAGSNGADSIYADGQGKCVQLPKYTSSQDDNGGIFGGIGQSLGAEEDKPKSNTAASAARTGPCGDNSTPFLLGLIAATIAVAPLLAVWAVLKGALSGAGAIGNKVSGAVQTYGNKGGEKASEKYKNSTVGQMRARSKKIREAETRAGRYVGKGGNFNPRTWRSGINRQLNDVNKVPGLNNVPGVQGYSEQRGRINKKADNEFIADKAEQFAADMSYSKEFQDGFNTFTIAPEGSMEKHNAELKMQAAVYAAGKAFDEDAQRSMRQQYRQKDDVAKERRPIQQARAASPATRADIDSAHTTALAQNNAMNSQAAAAARYASISGDHDEALSENSQRDKINAIADRREQADAAGKPIAGRVDNVDVARELAKRENDRRSGGTP